MKLGFVVNNLGPSQLNYYLIKNINEYVKDGTSDIVLFYEKLLAPCLTPLVANAQFYEAWGYNGTLVATNLNTASKILNIPTVKRKLYYIWNIEWTRVNTHYSVLRDIYCNPKLELVARCHDYAKIVSQCWNRKVAVADINEIIQYVH